MQTRFYDSEFPGPPNGWLDRDQGFPAQERAVWNHVVASIRATTRELAKSASGIASVQFWGGLQLDDLFWVYRSIPTEVGRPGRTVAVIFCSKGADGFNWTSIRAIAPELEALASDPSHLVSLLFRLDSSPSSTSLTDDLLKQPPTPLLEALKPEMGRLLAGLGDGDHAYFTIAEDGTVSNHGKEDISPKPPPQPTTPQPSAKTALPAGPEKKPQPQTPPLMKIFISHAIFLVIGLLLGYGLHSFSSPKPPAEKTRKSQPAIHSHEDAISHLRAATDYLEQSPGRRTELIPQSEPQTQPQRRSSTPRNPPN